jgi:hypothetical protein
MQKAAAGKYDLLTAVFFKELDFPGYLFCGIVNEGVDASCGA